MSAILPTLMVVVGKQTFALPLAGVNEIFHLDLTTTNLVDGQLTIIVREKAIPLFYLDQWLVRNYVEKKREKGKIRKEKKIRKGRSAPICSGGSSCNPKGRRGGSTKRDSKIFRCQ